ncbi:MAG: folate-binding protein YgfZ [Gaiellaceae bacterium]
MATVTHRVAERPRDYVRLTGPDAEDFLQRMVSNDVSSGEVCEALLLTPKARVIAPLVVVRRGAEDFLLLTEPGLGPVVQATLARARLGARVEIVQERHRSVVVLGGSGGIPNRDYGEPAAELLDADVEPTLPADELERLRIEAGMPAWGKEIDDRVLPAEAGLVERAVDFAKGCYPGQEPIARLRYRGHANRGLRRLRIETAESPAYDAEVRHGEKVVGRVTSSARAGNAVVALAYVRVEVPADAELAVGDAAARSLH